MYHAWRERADRRADPLTSAYRRVCARYAELGWMRAVAETPGAYSRRLLTVRAPYATDFQAISQQFCASRYREQTPRDGEPALIKELGRLDRRLRWLTLRGRMIRT
jgi:hypothetical protein